jgi:hypothetical protein
LRRVEFGFPEGDRLGAERDPSTAKIKPSLQPEPAGEGRRRVDAVRGLCQGYSRNGCFLGIERQTGMSQLEAAQRHLAQALERLEDALALRLAQPPPGTDADYQRAFAELTAERNNLARDVRALRSECDRLSAALSDMQRDHDGLRAVTGQVARRVDGSIAEIDRLLEG